MKVLFTDHDVLDISLERDIFRRAAMNIVDWMKTGRPGYPVVRGTRKPWNRLRTQSQVIPC